MIYNNNKVSDINITYIGGGSRGWAWNFINDLSAEKDISGTITLYDIDTQAAENNKKIGNEITAKSDRDGKWKYVTAPTLKEALTGTDFVVISILPGTFDEMEYDVHTPEKYGIYQSVGDTAGPGGLVRALRTIPMFTEIANAIKEHSPNAWVINYTNPMTICVKTLYHAFPEIKAFGCCHEVFGTQKILAHVFMEHTGETDIKREDIDVNVLGINHFTWFDKASCKGLDLFPIYKEFVKNNFEEGYNEPDKNWANSTFECAHRVKFELFNKYGYIAAAGDRHLAEFMPGDMYLKDPQTVSDYKFGLTTVSYRKADLEKRLARSERLLSGEEEMDVNKLSGEEGIKQIKALCGLGKFVTNVNVPNANLQISNLPASAVVETNAVFSKDSVQTVHAGALPQTLLELINPHVDNHEMILNAANTCDFELALKALANDPIVKDRLTNTQLREMLCEMIEGTQKYLPDGWKK